MAGEPMVGRPRFELPFPAMLPDAGRLPFVGRHSVWPMLDHAWAEVRAGGRGLVLLAGEPGVGKTRLATEFARRAYAEGAVILAGRCDEEIGFAYQPFSAGLSHCAIHLERDALRRVLGPLGGELRRLRPELAAEVTGLAEPLAGDTNTERYRLFDAVAGWLHTLSEDRPVVFLIDDLQWATTPTVLLLRHLLRSEDSMRVLFVATYRDTDLGRVHPLTEALADLRRMPGVVRAQVAGLDAAEVAELMASAVGQQLDRRGQEMADEIQRRTGGNAFFVGEMLRHLTESGRIHLEDGRLQYAASTRDLDAPESVRDLVRRRLSRLTDDTNRALSCASVEGMVFDQQVVSAAAELSEDDLRGALDEAVDAGLVHHAGSVRYRFAHQIIRDTLYEDILHVRRIRLHLRTAQAIEALSGARPGEHLADLAHHYAVAAPAGHAAEAVDAARRAAEQAQDAAAHEEAIRFYDMALEALQWQPDVATECDLTLAKATAQWRAGDPREARVVCERAAALARSTADADRLARVALTAGGGPAHFLWLEWGQVDEQLLALLEEALRLLPATDSALRAELLGMLARELAFVPGMVARRAELVAEALGMARRIADPQALGATLCFAVVATSGEITPQQRVGLASEIAAIGRELTDLELEIQGLFHLAHGHLELGEIDAVDAAIRRSEEIAAMLGQPFWRWLVACYRVMRLLLAGRSKDAEDMIAEALRLGDEAGEVHAYMAYGVQNASVTYARGSAARLVTPNASKALAARYPRTSIGAVAVATTSVLSGRYAEGRAAIEALARDGFASVNRDSAFAFSFGSLAWSVELLWEPTYADAVYDALLPYAGRATVPGGPYVVQGTVDGLLAGQACLAGKFDLADAHLDAHDQLAQRIGAPQLLAETHARRAVIALARGDANADALVARAEEVIASHADAGVAAELLVAATRGIAGLGPKPIDQRGQIALPLRQRFRAVLEKRAASVVNRLVRGKTDDELEKRFGSSRLQRMIFSGMARGFRPDLANGFEGNISFELARYSASSGFPDVDAWTIVVQGDHAMVRPGFVEQPAMTVRASLPDFCRLIAEELDPVAAVYDRRIRIEGDFLLALRLAELFGGASALSDVDD